MPRKKRHFDGVYKKEKNNHVKELLAYASTVNH